MSCEEPSFAKATAAKKKGWAPKAHPYKMRTKKRVTEIKKGGKG